MKIYTKTGDKGETGFIGGRISKASDMIELVGDLDELNASLGLVLTSLVAPHDAKLKQGQDSLQNSLLAAQRQIFALGALVAKPVMDVDAAAAERRLADTWVADLEKTIDAWDTKLPKLQNFILPGGAELGARLHGARAVARRAERASVRLQKGLSIQPDGQSTYYENIGAVQKYLNRLADFLFVAARFANQLLGEKEEIWSADSEQIRLGL